MPMSAVWPIKSMAILCLRKHSNLVMESDAVLFGAVGDPDCDDLERHLRPEQAVLGLRKEMQTFANLRPAKAFCGFGKPLGIETRNSWRD